ncbi:MAG: alpha/beta fold hydrolase [Deltaproteobacteria bacterium]|nr:alpha/beta fold hydrolase [Deltaproteobacteria bacterium]
MKARRIGLGLLALSGVVTGAAAAGVVVLTRRTKGHHAELDDVLIHYTDEGEGEPVLLVHGFAVNADLNWRRPGIIKALSPDYRVIAMDLRGHGRSGKPPVGRYGMALVQDIPRLLDHLDIERAHLVGYSLGGFVALKCAATHPDRLLSVAALGSGWEPLNQHGSAFESLAALADELEAGRGIEPLAGHLGADRQRPSLLHRFWVKVLTGTFNDKRALVGILRGVPELALSADELRGLQVPLCSIVGSKDPLVDGIRAMGGLVPDHSVTIVEGADHIRAPLRRELREALRTFLQQHGEAS